jgi:hypothetical protein
MILLLAADDAGDAIPDRGGALVGVHRGTGCMKFRGRVDVFRKVARMPKLGRTLAIVIILLLACSSCVDLSPCGFEARKGTSSSAETSAYRDCQRDDPHRPTR